MLKSLSGEQLVLIAAAAAVINIVIRVFKFEFVSFAAAMYTLGLLFSLSELLVYQNKRKRLKHLLFLFCVCIYDEVLYFSAAVECVFMS